MMDLSLAKIFGAGVATFFMPCIYPLIPIYLSALIGADLSEIDKIKRGQLVIRSLFFSVGFILVFSLMGLGAGGIGAWMDSNKVMIQLFAGVLFLVFALKFLGLIYIPFLDQIVRADDSKYSENVNNFSAFIMGVLFAAGWSPCVGPILGSVLTYTASNTSSIWTGMLYLTIYGAGFAFPLLIIAMFADAGVSFIHKTTRYLPYIERTAGLVLLFASVYFFNQVVASTVPQKSVSSANPACAAEMNPVKPNGKPIMVEFYAKSCHICKAMEPLVEEIKNQCDGKSIEIRKVDISDPNYRYLSKQFHLRGTPTFVFIDRDGKEVARLVGKQNKDSLLRYMGLLRGEQCPDIGRLPEVEDVNCGDSDEGFCTQP